MSQADWLTWSNPVAIWWNCLLVVSAANVALLLWLYFRFRRGPLELCRNVLRAEPLLLLSAAYVFGCAFRSILPRADVQRICLFDTWLSNVLVGRSVATVAEICFAAQWAIVLAELGSVAKSDTARTVSKAIVPLIVIAECCSWYAVITTNYLGNALENSLWAVTFLLIGLTLLRLASRFIGGIQVAIVGAAAGIAGYVAFMAVVDVPMYLARWQAEVAGGGHFFGLFAGLHDLATRWVVTRDIAQWQHEIAWMSLYFSVAVWSSLALAGFALVRELIPRHLTGPTAAKLPQRSASMPLGNF